jgi:glycosyltransferase involved in cell wall biosynthesis
MGDTARRRVLCVQYANPAAYPPIEHGAVLAAEAGADVLLLGTAVLGDSLVMAGHPRIRVELVAPPRPGWRQKLHYLLFVARALRRASRFRPTIVYASDPLAAPVGWLLTVLGRVPVVYHEHDSPEAEVDSVFMRGVGLARRRLAQRADICVVPSAGRADLFRQTTGRTDVIVVWNTPLRRDVVVRREQTAAPRLRLLYHGSIVASRLPLAIVEALAGLPAAVTLRVIGYEPAGGQHIARLRAAAARLGVHDRLEFMRAVPRHLLLRHASDCDAGLALLPIESGSVNERLMVGASNKVFDYLACGLPVIVTDTPEWRETYVLPGYGVACDPESPQSLEAVLRRLLENVQERWEMGERGRRRIQEEWHYERAFAPVLRRLLGPRAAVEATANPVEAEA